MSKDLISYQADLILSLDTVVKKAAVTGVFNIKDLVIFNLILKRYKYIRKKYSIDEKVEDLNRLNIIVSMLNRVSNLSKIIHKNKIK